MYIRVLHTLKNIYVHVNLNPPPPPPPPPPQPPPDHSDVSQILRSRLEVLKDVRAEWSVSEPKVCYIRIYMYIFMYVYIIVLSTLCVCVCVCCAIGVYMYTTMSCTSMCLLSFQSALEAAINSGNTSALVDLLNVLHLKRYTTSTLLTLCACAGGLQ